jgi:hypothetical protein
MFFVSKLFGKKAKYDLIAFLMETSIACGLPGSASYLNEKPFNTLTQSLFSLARVDLMSQRTPFHRRTAEI